ncbi:MAG: hypothetical protein IPL89_16190, partial [Acidobacteria bacterium]|nr:hypothetical protein [Acidobacteriota bacterium]
YPNVAPFNNEVHQWTYDAIGNRLTNQIDATIQTYTYEKIGANPKNAQKLMNDGTNAYAYDFNGSQVSRTGFGFGSDADNRLAAITGNETASYTYDYQGRRTSKTVAGVTTKYLYDGLNLVSETTAGATTRYAFGPSIDEPLALYASGAVSYLNADGLGSIVATNSATGTVSHGSVFDAWGVAKSETGTRIHPFTYTGRETGEAGLLFHRARWSQPATGAFTQVDPLSQITPSPELYRYARSAPTQFVDPTGLQAAAAMDPNGCEDKCKEIRDQIIAVTTELAKRTAEQWANKGRLPWTRPGTGGPGKNTIYGHAEQFVNKQRNLRNLIDDWKSNHCGDGLPADAWSWAQAAAPEPDPETVKNYPDRPDRPWPTLSPAERKALEQAIEVGISGTILYWIFRLAPAAL